MGRIYMKILIVAHPDDEVIWFNPVKYDKIIIVYTYRKDRPDVVKGRLKVQQKHPLKKKIIYLDYWETNFWRDPTKWQEYCNQMNKLEEWIKNNISSNDIITTHDCNGEYGHSDHILVHKAVTNTHKGKVKFSERGKIRNNKIIESIKKCYKNYSAWTWTE